MHFLYYGLLTLFMLLSLFLMLLVLIQKGRGGGLSAAFGGVGGNTAFGAKTGDVLTWATSAIFALFLLLAIGLNLIGNRIHADNQRLSIATSQPAATPAEEPSILTPPLNPTPEPKPTPTTNPSTKPTAVVPIHTDAALPPVDAPTTQPLKLK